MKNLKRIFIAFIPIVNLIKVDSKKRKYDNIDILTGVVFFIEFYTILVAISKTC